LRRRIGIGSSVAMPDSSPITAIEPPSRVAVKERGRVPAPPTSTVMSAPRPPVSLSASWSQSGVAL
jgi:hypothetical protein